MKHQYHKFFLLNRREKETNIIIRTKSDPAPSLKFFIFPPLTRRLASILAKQLKSPVITCEKMQNSSISQNVISKWSRKYHAFSHTSFFFTFLFQNRNLLKDFASWECTEYCDYDIKCNVLTLCFSYASAIKLWSLIYPNSCCRPQFPVYIFFCPKKYIIAHYVGHNKVIWFDAFFFFFLKTEILLI